MRRVLIVAVGALLAFLYAGAMQGLVVQWLTSPDASYGIILAAVAAALVWERRRFLPPHVDYPPPPAAALVTLAGGRGRARLEAAPLPHPRRRLPPRHGCRAGDARRRLRHVPGGPGCRRFVRDALVAGRGLGRTDLVPRRPPRAPRHGRSTPVPAA